jgi:putative ABC transport system permease protein
VSVFERDTHRETGPLSKQQYLYAKSRQDVFQWLGAARVSAGTITMAGQTAFVPIAAVTSDLAGIFGLSLDEGVVISHRMWEGQFGATAKVRGEEIRINGVTARISGIAPDWLEGIYRDRPVDVWIPLQEEAFERLDDTSRSLWVLARLGRDTSPNQAQAVVQSKHGARELRVLPYTGMTPEMAAGLARVGTLLEFAAGAVFFIACVNVGLFLLGRAFTRFYETALRVALGASRGQLTHELLSDSVVISVAGGVSGMLLAVWTSYVVPVLLYEQDAELLIFAPDLFSIAEASFVCVGITILCGLLPALVIQHERPMIVLQRDSAGASPTIRRLRLGLVAAQMASCCVLVISTAFLLDGLRTALVTSAGQRLGHTVLASVQANPRVAIEYFQQAESDEISARCIRDRVGRNAAGKSTNAAGVPHRASAVAAPRSHAGHRLDHS